MTSFANSTIGFSILYSVYQLGVNFLKEDSSNQKTPFWPPQVLGR